MRWKALPSNTGGFLEKLESITGKPINVLHIVGGGTQNKALCQFTADATATPVVAGPIEATAIGNIMVQAVASGAINSIADAREIVRRSFEAAVYEPQDSARWDEAFGRFLAITGLS